MINILNNTYRTTTNANSFFGAIKMAYYIITLDPSTYSSSESAEAAIAGTGAKVSRTYGFPLTYGAEATASQIASLAGVLRSENSTTELTPALSGKSVDDIKYDHLQTTAVSTTRAYYWHPVDTSLGKGQHVYLLDTGVNENHEEFVDATINNLWKSPESEDFADAAGHGTAMASIIVGKSIGTASGATLHNVKMFDDDTGTITVGNILDALDAVLTHHNANDPSQPKVVCMPWTITKNQLVDDKLNEMLQENLMLVASAGNRGNGVDIDDYSPGGLDTITTVGAHDKTFHVTPFTQMPLIDYVDEETTPMYKKLVQNAAKIDLFAIGSETCVADSATKDGYKVTSGTSVSASMVAGVITHYFNLYPNTTAKTIKSYVVTRGYEMAKLPRPSSSSEDYHTILSYDNLVFPEGKTADYDKISLSILSCPMASEVVFTTIPSGRLLNVQRGATAKINIGLKENVSNVAVLDFSPLSPWMSFDESTGEVFVDTTDSSLTPANISAGIFHFAVKGQVGDRMHVEEYSIGLYSNDEEELNSSTEFYYDEDLDDYEEVVTYNVAPSK